MKGTCTLIAVVGLAACSLRGGAPDAPSDTARHRAALASVTVDNQTMLALTIALRTATPPVQEVVIGRVAAGGSARMAPIPAGEPVILVARRNDGAEYQTPARSFALDAEFVWEIPKDAAFRVPAPRK